MNRLFSFLTFLTIVLTIYSGMHYFIYRRFVSGLDLSSLASRYLAILFILGGLSFIGGEILHRRLSFPYLTIPGTIWLGVIAILFAIMVLREPFLHIYPRFEKQTFYIAIGLIFLVSSWSLFNGLRFPRIKSINLSLEGLSAEMKGLKIVQLSDLHLDGMKRVTWLEYVVDRTNDLKPDLIVITGDFIDRSEAFLQDYLPILKRLHSRLGVFSIPGNHEYYSGIDNYLAFIQKAGIIDISNRVLLVGGGLQLAGIPDAAGTGFETLRPDPEGTLNRLDPHKPSVLLIHRPEGYAAARARGVDLILCGHTHAGQIPPMDFIVRLIYRYPYGLYDLGHTRIYTTCGTEYWGPPMRFLSRSEIAFFTLQ